MRCCCWIAGVFVHVRRGLASYTFFFFLFLGGKFGMAGKKKREGLRLSEELSRAGDGAACCCRLDVSARARNISLAALPPCVTCRAHPYSTRLHIDSFTPFTKKKKEMRWPRFYRRGRAEIERERNDKRREPDSTKGAVRSFVIGTMRVNHSRMTFSFGHVSSFKFDFGMIILRVIVTFREWDVCLVICYLVTWW